MPLNKYTFLHCTTIEKNHSSP